MKKMLSVGDVGDDVAGVHELLESQGLSLPASEVERKFFGPATREALRAFQIANGIDPSCEVCEKTASLLREGAGTKLAAAIPPTASAKDGSVTEAIVEQPGPGPATSSGASRIDVSGPRAAANRDGAPNFVVPSSGARGETSPEQFIVRGTVTYPDGRPAVGVRVCAFDKYLRGEEKLVDTTTDEKGQYEGRYTAAQFRRAEKGSAALRVAACEHGGRELITSDIQFNAPAEAVIDLVVASKDGETTAEFAHYMSQLAPLLEGADLAQMEAADIDYLAKSTGIARERVVWLASAHRLAQGAPPQSTGSQPFALPRSERTASASAAASAAPPLTEILYGWLRQSLPDSLWGQADANDAALIAAGERAISENIIGADARAALPGAIRALREAHEQLELAPSTTPGRSTLRDRFAATVDDARLLKLARTNATARPLTKAWRDDLKAGGLDERAIASVETIYVLDALTGDNHGLSRALQERHQLREPKDLRTLAQSMDRNAWNALVNENPPPNEDKAAYATRLARTLEHAFPGAAFGRAAAEGRLAFDNETQAVLKKFFRSNPDFEFGAAPISTMLKDKDAAARFGLSEQESPRAREALLSLDRIRKLTPKSQVDLLEATNALLPIADSAHGVVTMGRRDFVSRTAQRLGGEPVAEQLYNQAVHNSALAMAAAATYFGIDGSPVAALPGGAKLIDTPPPTAPNGGPMVASYAATVAPDERTATFEALFGSQDYCACRECRSIHGPAAYFVEILAHVWKKQPYPGMDQNPPPPAPPLYLFERRPDLGEIELTCENTITPVPYVDLVNEILEDAVAPPPGAIPKEKSSDTLIKALNAGNAKDVRAASAQLRDLPGFTDDSPIDVIKESVRWAAETRAHRYLFVADAQKIIVSRSRQTGGTAAERAAQPQYINDNAYLALQRRTYPWSAPFSLHGEMTDLYLNHFNVTRADLAQDFFAGDPDLALGDVGAALAYLGLSPVEAEIITGKPEVTELWGGALPTTVAELLQRSQLTYSELAPLLDCYCINPPVEQKSQSQRESEVRGETPEKPARPQPRTFGIVSTDGPPDTCDLTKLSVVPLADKNSVRLDPGQALRIVRFMRLRKKLGWSARDLDRAVAAFDVDIGADDKNKLVRFLSYLALLQYFSRLTGQPVALVIGWWSNLDPRIYADQTENGPLPTQSVYAQVFAGRTLPDARIASLPEDPSRLTGSLADNEAPIARGLGLSVQDTRLLFALLPSGQKASLSALSILFAHASLARTLGVSVKDYLLLREFCDAGPAPEPIPGASSTGPVLLALPLARPEPIALPLTTPAPIALPLIKPAPLTRRAPLVSPLQTLVFLRQAQRVLDAGISAAEAATLMRGAPDTPVEKKAEEDAAALALDALRKDLRQIGDALDAVDPASDASGEQLRKHLAMLNWRPEIIADVTDALRGTAVYSTPASGWPQTFSWPNAAWPVFSPTDLSPGVLFETPSSFANIIVQTRRPTPIGASRALDAAERTALLDAASNAANGRSDIIAALNALFGVLDAQPNPIWPVFSPIELPAGVSFTPPAALANVVVQIPRPTSLGAARALSAEERSALLTAANSAPAEAKDPILDSLNGLFSELDALEGDLGYDGAAATFTGVMTPTRKTRLSAASNPPPGYADAINALYRASRSQIGALLANFSARDFSATLPANAAPDLRALPPSLKDVVYVADGALHANGALRRTEREALKRGWPDQEPTLEALFAAMDQPPYAAGLAASNAALPDLASLPPALAEVVYIAGRKLYAARVLTQAERDALAALFGNTPYAGAPAELFKRMDEQPSDFVADAYALLSPGSAPASRIETVLGMLLPFLRRAQSEDAVARKLAQSLQISFGAADDLLRIHLAAADPLSALRDPAFIASSAQITSGAFPAQFSAFALARRVAGFVQKLSLSREEIAWLFSPPGADRPLLDLATPPAAATGPRLGPLARTLALCALRTRLPNASPIVSELLTMARKADQSAPKTEAYLKRIAALTRWPEQDVIQLAYACLGVRPASDAEAFATNAAAKRAFINAEGLGRLITCFDCLARLGMSVATVIALAQQGEVSPTTADAVVQAVRAKFDDAGWLDVTRPLRDQLRERQRQALTDYLITKSPGAWRSANDLYAHFLIDVEMSACQLTSRIKQAISTVQLYVQRVLLGLEPKYPPGSIDPEMWKWMKSYRVWEANRKVLLYPENWIEPELRRDKTPFFAELEAAIGKGDPSPETLEPAFLAYLDKLESVARLEVVGAFGADGEVENSGKNVHVIARSFQDPRSYWYRQRIDGHHWTPWESVDVGLEGDHIAPVFGLGEVHLFWLNFLKKTKDEALTITQGSPITDPKRYWDVRVASSSRGPKGWTPKKLLDTEIASIPSDYQEENAPVDRFWLFAGGLEDRVYLVLCAPLSGGATPKWKYRSLSKLRRIQPFHLFSDRDAEYEPYAGTGIRSTRRASHLFVGAGPLSIPLWTNTRGLIRPTVVSPRTALRISIANRQESWFGNDPFFVQSDRHTYFVHQSEFLDFDALLTIGLKEEYPALFYGVKDPTATEGLRFRTFFHPCVDEFCRSILVGGLDAFFSLKNQDQRDKGNVSLPHAYNGQSFDIDQGAEFVNAYQPTNIVDIRYPAENADFSPDGAYSQYNWELFFHAPFLMATRLSKNQRFDEARRWFHFIFDPTSHKDPLNPNPNPSPKDYARRFWKVLPFYKSGQGEPIQELMRQLARDQQNPGDPTDLEIQVQESLKHPFDPHAIAAWRPRAYQLSVVMKYLDNLIAWGDQLFRRDTIESINEATQLYILASALLGRRPNRIPPRARPVTQTFNTLMPNANADLTTANVLVAIEDFISPSAAPSSGSNNAPPAPLMMLYFCVPYNEKLISYWDTVEDRLYKIRHCMNIEGVERQLPLFEPPIDPAMLVKAAAAGIDITSALSDMNAPLPAYRFNVMAQKATELCAEVKALGGALLAALEKRDGEAMALLRSGQEIEALTMTRTLKSIQLQEAEASLQGLTHTMNSANERLNHNLAMLSELQTVDVAPTNPMPGPLHLLKTLHTIGQTILEASSPHKLLEACFKMTSEEIGKAVDALDKVISGEMLSEAQASERATLPMNRFEKRQLDELKEANEQQLMAMDAEMIATFVGLIPDVKLGVPPTIGATFGGTALSAIARVFANRFNFKSSQHSYAANQASILGGYKRRALEWSLQCKTILEEIQQISTQMIAAQLRVLALQQEIGISQKQIENARAVDQAMRDKYTNQELYEWTSGQIAATYFQSYQLAYDAAKRAERAYRFELGLETSDFIKFGYWDSLRKGLLAGESLSQDIKRMESAYLDQNKREYEITKHVSLLSLDPEALIALRQNGRCEFVIPEVMYDLDFPGHFMRRIKSVSVTIPCVAGPYAGVNCTLTLLRSSVRSKTGLSPSYARDDAAGADPRFVDSFGAIQSVVTSSAQNDSGLFETNLRDERYLPFEGSGAISAWRLELPEAFRAFDYDTISDVVLHIRYTARSAGAALKAKANAELASALGAITSASGRRGLNRLISLRQEFPREWAALTAPLEPNAAPRAQKFIIAQDRFPFLFAQRGRKLKTNTVRIYAAPREGAPITGAGLLGMLGVQPPTGLIAQVSSAANLGRLGGGALTLSSKLDIATITDPNDAAQRDRATWTLTAPPAVANGVFDLVLVVNYSVS
jgi:Tc toxin complex TcA C-terminal TcB-binding domain/ABC toxin N-terminal region/Neuraminidase-like domain